MKIVIDGMVFGGQSKVHEYYRAKFPEDELGQEINLGLTFQEVYEALYIGVDIYMVLGVGDSIVRERVFDAMATMMECSYEHIYYQWLNNSHRPLHGLIMDDLKGLRFYKEQIEVE
jgi:hypothetical protein